jgi:carbonic anhydrase
LDATDDLLANNRAFAARYDRGHRDVRPSLRLAIVTCMDSRLDVFSALGLENGQAHILRNAGGVITDDVIRSLALSQRRLGTQEVMLIHHTDRGLVYDVDTGVLREVEG